MAVVIDSVDLFLEHDTLRCSFLFLEDIAAGVAKWLPPCSDSHRRTLDSSGLRGCRLLDGLSLSRPVSCPLNPSLPPLLLSSPPPHDHFLGPKDAVSRPHDGRALRCNLLSEDAEMQSTAS